jgi:hypothetical protein
LSTTSTSRNAPSGASFMVTRTNAARLVISPERTCSRHPRYSRIISSVLEPSGPQPVALEPTPFSQSSLRRLKNS